MTKDVVYDMILFLLMMWFCVYLCGGDVWDMCPSVHWYQKESIGSPGAGVSIWEFNSGYLEEQKVLFNYWAVSQPL